MADSEMREPTFLMLSALAGGRKHGYAIIQDAAEASSGRVQLKPGTLYTALDRLGDAGLVERAGDEVVDGRLRRYFELTSAGESALASEARRQQSNATLAMARLALRPAAAL